jgi:L-amino acid N-acyltransferase YncA
VLVRPLHPDDYPAVSATFAEGIATGLATFETTVPTWEDWDATHLDEHRFVAELDGDVVGWVAVVPYSRRTVYRAWARRASMSRSAPAAAGSVGRSSRR